MKILIGSYQCESNTFSTARARKQDFEILRGWDVVEKLVASKLFFEHGFEVVPMLYATALPSGKVEKRDYLEILDEFLDIARENRDADGIYLYFHGAMYVDEMEAARSIL
jgi:microcystin degradation protein MlrC